MPLHQTSESLPRLGVSPARWSWCHYISVTRQFPHLSPYMTQSPPPHTHTFPLANAECPIPYSHEPFDILKLHAPGCTHSLTEHNYSDFEAYITAVKTVLSKVRLSARFSLCLMWLVMTANTMWTSWNSLCTTVRRLYAGLLISTEWRTIELTFCLPATWTLSDAGSCVTALCFRHCFISSWLLEKWTEWLKHQFN